MKWKVITLSLLIFLFMSCSSAVNYQAPVEKSESQISSYTVAALEPLVKGSSGSRSSSSSSKSSSSKKVDIDDDDLDAGTDDGSTPWWLIALILVVVGVIAVVVIWYLFLRK